MEHISSIIKRVVEKAEDDMKLHQEQADLIAERIGSDDHDRRDGASYEHHAIEAQKAASRAQGMKNCFNGAWENLRPEDFCI